MIGRYKLEGEDCMTCCNAPWVGKAAICMSSESGSRGSENPNQWSRPVVDRVLPAKEPPDCARKDNVSRWDRGNPISQNQEVGYPTFWFRADYRLPFPNPSGKE
jgi:hypothetical protein